MVRRTLVLAALCCLSLLAPAAALAQQDGSNAPPGNSAIDEYVETVPGASGNRSPRVPDATASPALTGSQRAALVRQGDDGERLAQLIDETAPVPVPARTAAPKEQAPTRVPQPRGTSARTPSNEPVVEVEVPVKATESPVKATLVAAIGPNDAGGLGVFFPVILLASLVGMVALAVRRRLSA